MSIALKNSEETAESLPGAGFSKQIPFEAQIWLLVGPDISAPFDASEIPEFSNVPPSAFLLKLLVIQRSDGQSLFPSIAFCCLFSPLWSAVVTLEGSLPFYCFFSNIF